MRNWMIRAIVFTGLFVVYIYYSVMVYSHGADDRFNMPESAVYGKELFQEHNCIACHQVYKLGGHLGPELTDVYSKRNNVAYLKGMILGGSRVMPDFGLSENEADALVQYLKYLDHTVKLN